MHLLMREAALYSKIKDGVRCDVCARRCVIREGETGFCRVRTVRDGKLYTIVYGLLDGMADDPIEKKPLFHFAPGSHAFSISTSSCNFRCQFCLNYHSAHRKTPVGTYHSPEEIVNLAQRYDCAGITYTYTEPTVFIEIAHDTAVIAHERGMFNTFVTNGYMTREAIDYMTPYLNAASINFKGSGNKQFYKEYMSVPKVDPIYDSMEYMHKKGVRIEITNLIIPKVGDFPEDTRRMAEWTVEHLGPRTPYHVIAFAPTYKMTHLPRTPSKVIEKHIQIAKDAGLEFIYSGNVPGHDYENTHCPECGFKAVERYSVFLKSNNLSPEGKCPKCGADLNIGGVKWMVLGRGSRSFF
ncbi:MAG: AmmeMemoRadiSam system radical SAM enzyme [Candidatus Thorarchaeota archaeon]|nr:MAG: AmmeMemoRadiSam system radical SAM enzyme [Candidatus Thorarchaeota archaeon]RLI58790.1 MAG: AmmeMemoRadiSam system radical SAM enzyme [Candidatus Thorarchaeota archaeon]